MSKRIAQSVQLAFVDGAYPSSRWFLGEQCSGVSLQRCTV